MRRIAILTLPSTPDRARQEADDPRPVSYYGKSKLAAELAAHEFRDTVPITVIRPPIVLGPGDRDGLEMFKSVAHWGVHMVPVRETMLVSWIDVRDLSMALIEVACRGRRLDTHERGQGIYFAAASESPDYADLGNELAAALASGEPIGDTLKVKSLLRVTGSSVSLSLTPLRWASPTG